MSLSTTSPIQNLHPYKFRDSPLAYKQKTPQDPDSAYIYSFLEVLDGKSELIEISAVDLIRVKETPSFDTYMHMKLPPKKQRTESLSMGGEYSNARYVVKSMIDAKIGQKVRTTLLPHGMVFSAVMRDELPLTHKSKSNKLRGKALFHEIMEEALKEGEFIIGKFLGECRSADPGKRSIYRAVYAYYNPHNPLETLPQDEIKIL